MIGNPPLSTWIRKGGFIFVSGCTGWDTETGNMPTTFDKQMRNTLLKLESALIEAGATIEDVVKVTVFLRDANFYDKMNKIYLEFFKPPYPSRTTVQASPCRPNAKIEVDLVAYIG